MYIQHGSNQGTKFSMEAPHGNDQQGGPVHRPANSPCDLIHMPITSTHGNR